MTSVREGTRLGICLGAAAVLTGCSSPPASVENLGVASAAYTVDPSAFTLPPSDAQARAQILARYTQLDPQGIVPRGLLEDAIEFFDINQANIPVQTFITVVDFSKFSGELRLFLVDMQAGTVEPHMVAHGSGSNPNDTGFASEFSNVSGSHMSSLGFYLAGEIYDGTHIHSMRLDGLSPDGSPNSMANTNVRARLVVMHEASYVSDSNTGAQGRSDGCLALDPSIEVGVVDRLHDGSLLYAEIAPLNPPIGASPPPPPPPPPDAGAGAPDAGTDPPDAGPVWRDAGSGPPPDAGAATTNPSPTGSADGGPPRSAPGNDGGGNGSASAGGTDDASGWGASRGHAGCAVAPGTSPATRFGLALPLFALVALRRRRRARR